MIVKYVNVYTKRGGSGATFPVEYKIDSVQLSDDTFMIEFIERNEVIEDGELLAGEFRPSSKVYYKGELRTKHYVWNSTGYHGNGSSLDTMQCYGAEKCIEIVLGGFGIVSRRDYDNWVKVDSFEEFLKAQG